MKRLSAGAAAFAAAGMLVLLYAAVLSFFVRLASGLLLTALLGAVLLLTGMFYKPLKKRKWPLGLLCAAYALLLAFVLFPALYSRNDTVTYDEDVLIVLGAGLDGEAVTPQLENRLEAAYAYHLRNPDAPVVVSGGQRDGEAISEALAMERWLISRGVPADRILREEASTSTYENLTNAKALLDERLRAPAASRWSRAATTSTALRGWPKRRGWTLRTSTRTPSGTRCRCACCANARRSSNIGYREHKETARSGFPDRRSLCRTAGHAAPQAERGLFSLRPVLPFPPRQAAVCRIHTTA